MFATIHITTVMMISQVRTWHLYAKDYDVLSTYSKSSYSLFSSVLVLLGS